jgi:hypothetical protein
VPKYKYKSKKKHYKTKVQSSGGYKGRPRSLRERWGGNIIGTILIVIAVVLFLAGLVALISPMSFLWMVSHLSEDMQIGLFGDIFWGATPRSWAYLIAAVVLWLIGGWLRSGRIGRW